MAEKLGDFLKQVRSERGYSLKEAKNKTKISEAYLWQLENGRREIPRPDTLKKLADGYDVPEETLLSYAGYDIGVADAKKVEYSDRNNVLKEYEKLPDEAKKDLIKYLKYLRNSAIKK